jgi:hypothetical protein
MSLKDLYKNTKKPIKARSLDDFKAEGVESFKALEAANLNNKKLVPRLDYSKPENFAIYGLAEEYYDSAMKHVYNSYPYDGSESERIHWELSASALETYVYDNLYPKTNGHAKIGLGSTLAAVAAQNNYKKPASDEYIYFVGGPHTSSSPMASSPLYQNFSDANKFDEDENLKSNLSFTGTSGATVEFWMKKPAFNTTQSDKQVIFDVSNGATFGAASYLRFRVELVSGSSADAFRFELMSGSSGSFYAEVGTGLDVDDNNWAHYALAFKNNGSNLNCSLYRNGALNQTVTTGSSIGSFNGALAGQIGSLYTNVSGAHAGKGWGLLSASLDDFRFWRKHRTYEEIGRGWRNNVFGGTNTDRDKNPDLGLYFKFNEGIFNAATTDSRDNKVLDYSGRMSNGKWTGYAVGARSTDSAIVLAAAANAEAKDPIIYSAHPDVSALATSLQKTGSMYDNQNHTSLYRSFASFIQEEDDNKNLKNLCQVMSSYLDTLYGQIFNISKISNIEYPTDTDSAYSFMQQALSSRGFEATDIFLDASVLETFRNRSEKIIFEDDVIKVKNSIFHNIYNNLTYLNKSKGTKKALRNLLHCFGISEDLVRVNTYGNNTTYTMKDSYREVSKPKNYVDFLGQGRTDGVVYNGSDAGGSNERTYLAGGTSLRHLGATLEGQFIFPERPSVSDDSSLFNPSFRTNSLMGIKEASSAKPTSNTWVAGDNAELIIRSVRPANNQAGAYFELTSSHFGLSLTSSTFDEVYNNQHWVIGAKVYHEKYPISHISHLGTTGSYILELCGYNTQSDITLSSFSVTASVTSSRGEEFFDSAKRVYAGAYRTNITGAVVNYSDVLASSIRYYNDKLDNKTVERHGKEPFNIGAESALENISVAATGSIKKVSSLALAWEFHDVSGSNAAGSFVTKDFSSGSLAKVRQHGSSSLAQSVFIKHPGVAYGFPVSSGLAINRQYMDAVEKTDPEVTDGTQLVRVLSTDDRIFEKEQEPEEYFSSIEMNSAQPINDEIMRYFASMRDLNTAIGTPANKYRERYKHLEYLRKMFFERVENTPDAETYFEYFKWIDDAVNNMLFQFLPMSADVLENSLKTIESHVLDRSKIVHKYPHFEYKLPVLQDALHSCGAVKTKWSVTHHPVNNSEGYNCPWWATRAEKTATSVGNAVIDAARQDLFNAYDNREKNIDLTVEIQKSNYIENKEALSTPRRATHDITIAELKIGSGGYIIINPSDLNRESPICYDDADTPPEPRRKFKYNFNYNKE